MKDRTANTNASPDNAAGKAVIYSRVGSATEEERASGHEAQRRKCAAYAETHGYTVSATFSDDASANNTERRGLKALLAFLKEHEPAQHVVLVDDLSRLARSVRVHLKLRQQLSNTRGVIQVAALEHDKSAKAERERD